MIWTSAHTRSVADLTGNSPQSYYSRYLYVAIGLVTLFIAITSLLLAINFFLDLVRLVLIKADALRSTGKFIKY